MKNLPSGHTASIGGDFYGKGYFPAGDFGTWAGNRDV